MPDVVTRELIDGLDRELLVQGPTTLAFTNEDALEIDSLCSIASVTIVISGVMLGSDFRLHPFKFTHTPNSNRTIATTRQQIGVGWLLHARAVISSGAPLLGQCFVWLRMCRGLTSAAETHGTIGASYLTANTDLFVPSAQLQNPLDGEGAALAITVANPAAGAEWSQTVPTAARWLLTAVACIFTSAVAAANRSVRLVVDDGATTIFAVPAPAVQAASLVGTYAYGAGAGGPVTTDPPVYMLPLANGLWLPAGFRIRTSTGNIQAADQYSAIRIYVAEYFEGN